MGNFMHRDTREQRKINESALHSRIIFITNFSRYHSLFVFFKEKFQSNIQE